MKLPAWLANYIPSRVVDNQGRPAQSYFALAKDGALILQGGVPFLYADEQEAQEIAEEHEGAEVVRVFVVVEAE